MRKYTIHDNGEAIARIVAGEWEAFWGNPDDVSYNIIREDGVARVERVGFGGRKNRPMFELEDNRYDHGGKVGRIVDGVAEMILEINQAWVLEALLREVEK